MQNVSQAYKDSMKSPLRERAYIKLLFGLINREAQASAVLGTGDELTYFSNSENLFAMSHSKNTYATLEENFTKVDGTMYFLPREGGSYVNECIVSNKLVSEAQFAVIVNFDMEADNIKGLTIEFGENYPVNFDLISGSQVVEIRGNTEDSFVTEAVFTNTTQIKLLVYEMKNPQSRCRIYSMEFGFGLLYDNEKVMKSTLESYVSPIGADVPQIDCSVEIENYDGYFNVDNPESAINYLETGQEMEIRYGYQLPDSDTIEWVKGGKLLCSEWEADDYKVTIRCQDVFRNMDGEYYKGTYNSSGITYYDLAEDVLIDAGYDDYYIDSSLKSLVTKNPLPRVTHKEALQIIANACRCTLSQNRDGLIQIIPSSLSTVNDFTMTRDDDMTSSPKAIKQEVVKEVVVPCYLYQNGTSEETLLTEDVTVTAGDVETYYLGEAAYNFRVTLNESATNVSIVTSGNYYVTIKFNATGTFSLAIYGYHYKVVESYATRKLNNRGKSVKWENPLISSMSMATDLANWLGEHYSTSIEYEYSTRGNPELDVNDIIYQENAYVDDMKVKVYRHTINFEQSFSGKVTARRVGG